jgi:hypothetical protein
VRHLPLFLPHCLPLFLSSESLTDLFSVSFVRYLQPLPGSAWTSMSSPLSRPTTPPRWRALASTAFRSTSLSATRRFSTRAGTASATRSTFVRLSTRLASVRPLLLSSPLSRRADSLPPSVVQVSASTTSTLKPSLSSASVMRTRLSTLRSLLPSTGLTRLMVLVSTSTSVRCHFATPFPLLCIPSSPHSPRRTDPLSYHAHSYARPPHRHSRPFDRGRHRLLQLVLRHHGLLQVDVE